MKDKIYQDVVFRLDEVSLTIGVTDKLKKEDSNFGYIEVSNGSLDEKHPCFWDNVSFFIDVSYKVFKEECGEDLEKGEFNKKETFKSVKRLIKKAKKLKLL